MTDTDRDVASAAAEGAPDAAFEAWLAESANFAATSLLGLTLRPTFDAGWDAAVEAARPAPAVAPREGELEAFIARLLKSHLNLENLVCQEFGGDTTDSDAFAAEWAAAREAARGEG